MEQENTKKIIKVNTYNYIYESCSICGRSMYKTSQIYVTCDTDRYICRHCKDKYGIEVVRCRDLD